MRNKKAGFCLPEILNIKEVVRVNSFALSGGEWLLYLIIVYGAGSYLLFRIGQKFGIGTLGQYFIPVYNMVLLYRCIDRSPWMLLGWLIPIVNIGFMIHYFYRLTICLGQNFWYYFLGSVVLGIIQQIVFGTTRHVSFTTLLLTTALSWIPMAILAFGNSQPVNKEKDNKVWDAR